MKAKTDSGPTEHNSEKPDYIANLFTLMQMVSGPMLPLHLNMRLIPATSGMAI